jgi:predicted PurR-regulated permease PerM
VTAVRSGNYTPYIVIIGGLLVWQLYDVLLLVFSAVLVACILRSLSDALERHTPLSSGWALVASCLITALILLAFIVLLGAQIEGQVVDLAHRLPPLLASLGDRFGISDLAGQITGHLKELSTQGGLVGKVAGYTTSFVAVIADIVVVIVAGVYLAIEPRLYRKGLLLLVPQARRAEIGDTLDNAGRALRLWLIGQVAAMAMVGSLVAIGLLIIGVPTALALGFLAGVAEFVPLIGPVAGAIPALLVALSKDLPTFYWTLGLYVVIQQIEGNVIIPLIQRRAVDLPPVLTLFAILSFGLLFGPLGILLATPLCVVLYVAVKQLYVRDVLNEETDVPGERS